MKIRSIEKEAAQINPEKKIQWRVPLKGLGGRDTAPDNAYIRTGFTKFWTNHLKSEE